VSATQQENDPVSTVNRLKGSTAIIATFAAGLVLLAVSGHANAKSGNGSQGQGSAANNAGAGSAAKTTPVYTCMACRFVKRDGDDKLNSKLKLKPGRDMAARDMAKQAKPRRDKQAASKPVETTAAKPSQPAATKPVPPATPPLATVKISNGVTTSLIKDAPGGLLVTSTSPGTITISNGKNSVTFPNEAVSLSGAVSVGAGAGVQAFREKTGDIVVRLPQPPAPPTPPPAAKLPHPGTVTGGPEGGFLSALGHGIENGGKSIVDGFFSIGSPTPGTPGAGVQAPKTSITTQQ
jgi:hypothetical protein